HQLEPWDGRAPVLVVVDCEPGVRVCWSGEGVTVDRDIAKRQHLLFREKTSHVERLIDAAVICEERAKDVDMKLDRTRVVTENKLKMHRAVSHELVTKRLKAMAKLECLDRYVKRVGVA